MEENDVIKDTETEEPFKTDEFGRIKLTQEMRDAAIKAERDYEDGKCLSEADFKERFAKWLSRLGKSSHHSTLAPPRTQFPTRSCRRQGLPR